MFRSGGERKTDGFRGGVNPLFVSGNGDLLDELVLVERDPSHDIRAIPLAFSLPLGRGDLVSVSAGWEQGQSKKTLPCRHVELHSQIICVG